MIYSFKDKVKLDDVGGKAYNLYHLKSHGFNVPKWVVLPKYYFKQFLGEKYQEYREDRGAN